ncbi:MAG: SHOCT domain-containing protein [Spirochaetales bacterium]|nr:SHOCT domain-containing protein [Spirochaetales bacterium]
MSLFSRPIGSCINCRREVKKNAFMVLKDGNYVCNSCVAALDIDKEIIGFLTASELLARSKTRELNKRAFLKLCPTTTQTIDNAKLLVYDNEKAWAFVFPGDDNPTIFRYDDIQSFDITEDGNSITSGSFGSAALGSFLAGNVGAIVGAVIGKKTTKNTVSWIRLTVNLNNKFRRQLKIRYDFNNETTKDEAQYIKISNSIRTILNTFKIMYEKSNANQKTYLQDNIEVNNAEAIRKYKQLLDDGIISQIEFEEKKNALLGISL